jgi:hypothetical protein
MKRRSSKKLTIRERQQRNPRDGTASVTSQARDRAIEIALRPVHRKLAQLERKIENALKAALVKAAKKAVLKVTR